MRACRSPRFLFLAAAVHLAAPVGAHQQEPSRGEIVARVESAAIPQQTYALYLPSNYTSQRRWPIIYAFDPAARGAAPVELLKEAAEKYGYIVAGSNTSRNGPYQIQTEAANAIWADTHQRFAIDDSRVYVTGFSGGARAATAIAISCDCMAGVITHGAGFPGGVAPKPDMKFDYFAAIGAEDFNYTEVVELAEKLDEAGVANRLRRFDGPHRWSPPEVWVEAVEWMELRAMRRNLRPRDAALIAQLTERILASAKAMEAAGDVLSAYDAYQQLAADLDGLAANPANAAAREATERLRNSAALREARERERRAIRRQKELIQEFAASFAGVGDAARRAAALREIRSQIDSLASRLERAKDSVDQLTMRRALSQMFVNTYESGETAVREKNDALAAEFFELASRAAPKSPGAYFQLARAHARMGRKKEALDALQRAVANGLTAGPLRANLADFKSIESDSKFQEILARLPLPM